MSEPADRPALVLIPGLLCDATVWPSQIAALADLADVRVAEHGMQDSLPAMARSVLDQAPPRFAVAGHSMGGRVALEVYRAAPERVTGVALMDTGQHALPPGEAGEREKAGRRALLEVARAQGMRAMARQWVQGMVHPGRLGDRVLIDGILDMFETKTAQMYENQIRALVNRPDAASVLPKITCPALVLCGHEDSWSPVERHREIANAIPNSTLEVIAACGHMCTLERPLEVNAALRAWFERVRSGQGLPARPSRTRERA